MCTRALLVGWIGCLLAAGAEISTGQFAGPVSGLRYVTATTSGLTDSNGQFRYADGEAVTFSIGGVVLGTTKGAERISIANLLSRVNGRIDKVRDPELSNMARFLQTLDQDGLVENGITIASQVHAIVGSRRIDFSHIPRANSEGDEQRIRGFAEDPTVIAILADLNRGGVFTAAAPRHLRSAAAARNEMRRNILGIVKTTDVKIPMRDGSFLFADIFRPAREGKYPPVLDLSVYGKAFERGCICNAQDAETREEWEDRYFSGNPDGFQYENHEAVNSTEWVPKGYVAVRIDTRGTCRSPGSQEALSYNEALTFYDAIEWAAAQPWSNGNVGLWGMSYTAINQQKVASLQPPHLKAMVSIGTDIDSYEDMLFTGGLPIDEFLGTWWFGPVNVACSERKRADLVTIMKQNPFNDPSLFGPAGSLWMSPDMTKVTVPSWIVMPQTHRGHIHQLGSSEAYIHTNTKNKKLDIVEDWFQTAYNSVEDHLAFFDHWLKGASNGVMNAPPVRIQVRTGDGSYFLQHETEWPIARTKYTRWYLDASASQWNGDSRRKDFLRLNSKTPASASKASYSAQVDIGALYPRELAGTPCWATGVSFVSEPLAEDTVLAGYMKLGLWVSSTSSDMDIYASVRVIDEQNREVNYSGPIPSRESIRPSAASPYPPGIGWLKASHRKLDPKRTTEYRPHHTHLKQDYAPLKKDEITPVEVLIWPSSALAKKGSRLRVDIQPYTGCGHGTRHGYDAGYHTGASNTIYTGPEHPSYLQLPVIPPAAKEAIVGASR